VIAPDQRTSYAESIVLPSRHLYAARRRQQMLSPSRREAALPEHGFVFCSFNNSFKNYAGDVRCLGPSLTAVEGKRAVVAEFPPAAMRNLKHEAELRGVNADRLLSRRLPRRQMTIWRGCSLPISFSMHCLITRIARLATRSGRTAGPKPAWVTPSPGGSRPVSFKQRGCPNW